MLWTVIAPFLLMAASASAQSNFKTLYKFKDGADGGLPQAGLIFDQAGSLYGTAEGGGKGGGVVFQLVPKSKGGWTQKVLYQFMGGEDGAFPAAGLIFDPTGSLYSTTAEGGTQNSGTVFQLAPNSDGSWTENPLYSFCSTANCVDGSTPVSSLVLGSSGALYGTTINGGANQAGVVFQLQAAGDIVPALFAFMANGGDDVGLGVYLGDVLQQDIRLTFHDGLVLLFKDGDHLAVLLELFAQGFDQVMEQIVHGGVMESE